MQPHSAKQEALEAIQRMPDTARIRLISAREATRRERQQYENEPR